MSTVDMGETSIVALDQKVQVPRTIVGEVGLATR